MGVDSDDDKDTIPNAQVVEEVKKMPSNRYGYYTNVTSQGTYYNNYYTKKQQSYYTKQNWYPFICDLLNLVSNWQSMYKHPQGELTNFRDCSSIEEFRSRAADLGTRMNSYMAMFMALRILHGGQKIHPLKHTNYRDPGTLFKIKSTYAENLERSSIRMKVTHPCVWGFCLGKDNVSMQFLERMFDGNTDLFILREAFPEKYGNVPQKTMYLVFVGRRDKSFIICYESFFKKFLSESLQGDIDRFMSMQYGMMELYYRGQFDRIEGEVDDISVEVDTMKQYNPNAPRVS